MALVLYVLQVLPLHSYPHYSLPLCNCMPYPEYRSHVSPGSGADWISEYGSSQTLAQVSTLAYPVSLRTWHNFHAWVSGALTGHHPLSRILQVLYNAISCRRISRQRQYLPEYLYTRLPYPATIGAARTLGVARASF